MPLRNVISNISTNCWSRLFTVVMVATLAEDGR